MVFSFVGGTARQQQLVNDALADCSFPLDLVDATVTVTWGSTPSSDTSHPYMVTSQTGGTTFTITIEPWADDPTYPENQGMPDPPANIDQFYRESFVHEIGHVISFLTFVRTQASITQMCNLFWTAQIGATGGKRQGNSSDFDPSSDWGLRIIEAVAEVFKCAFCTTPRVFENRSLWHLEAADFSQFLELLSIQNNISSVAWQASSATCGQDQGGVFDLVAFFGSPLVVSTGFVSTTLNINADFAFQDNQASVAQPDEIDETNFGLASWRDRNERKTINRSYGDSQTQFLSGPGTYHLDFLYGEGLSFGRYPIALINTHWQVQTTSPHAFFANHRYTVSYEVQVFDENFVPGDWIRLDYNVGYDDVSFVPYFFVNIFGQINGVTRNTQLFGSIGPFLAGWVGWSDSGLFDIGLNPVGFTAEGNYPFVDRVGSIDVARSSLRGALAADTGIHGRAPAVGPGGFIGDPNPPHVVLQLTDTQKQSQQRRGAAGSNGLRGALVP